MSVRQWNDFIIFTSDCQPSSAKEFFNKKKLSARSNSAEKLINEKQSGSPENCFYEEQQPGETKRDYLGLLWTEEQERHLQVRLATFFADYHYRQLQLQHYGNITKFPVKIYLRLSDWLIWWLTVSGPVDTWWVWRITRGDWHDTSVWCTSENTRCTQLRCPRTGQTEWWRRTSTCACLQTSENHWLFLSSGIRAWSSGVCLNRPIRLI